MHVGCGYFCFYYFYLLKRCHVGFTHRLHPPLCICKAIHLMSLGKLEKGARATDVCEVLLQHALGQTCQKELKEEETKEFRKPCKGLVNAFVARISGERGRKEETRGLQALVTFTQAYICRCFLPRVFLGYEITNTFSFSSSKWCFIPFPCCIFSNNSGHVRSWSAWPDDHCLAGLA